MSDKTQVNGYELHEKLGSGGFGAVYRAYQPTVGREVAIKIILPRHASRPEFVRRFEIEAQVIARLEHMNIVPLYDYWRDPDGAYLVMRYMRGGSLRQMIKQAPYEPGAALILLEQIAGALAIAHRNGVIHRDLKPENVLLDEDGNAYLGDFGIAKNLAILDSHTDTGDVIGSPGYLAPEQARGETVAPQTDVYSLGVMLYEVLCGEHPFPNTNPVEKIYKHLNEPLPLLNNLAPDVEAAINDVIHKATAKNPLHRYENAVAFAEAFRQAAAIERDSSDVAVEMLTPREQQVLHYVIAGKSNRQIGETLVVEVSTVKWYIKQIYRKLNVHNRVQAIVRGRELNLVVGDEDKGDHTYLSTYYELRDVKNPYKGLRAFETVDSDDFFGRDKLIKKLVTRLDLNNGAKGGRFLAVVGPSGSGKSSVVKAGLIPALWRGDLPNSENWYVAEVLPGPRPLDELEITLTRLAPDNSINLREQLERDEHGLLRAAQLILPDDGSELLVVIDQFEEVFTLVEDEARRQHFLDLIHAAVIDQRSRVRVVVTLRADFYDRPLQYPHLGDLMREHMETVLPLSAEELQQVILKPAEKTGIRYEEGLVARIIGDVNYQPGSLPLLQYALTELFDRRDGRTITQEAYTEIGGTVGALAKRADELFAEFDEDGQEAIRQMFMRLITLGEGTEDTRRRVQRSELLSVSEDTDLMEDVIDSFVGYRLLALDNDPTTREPTVEVAHEAILREWERLRGWLNDSRDDIKTQRQLSTLAAEWESHQRSNDYMVRGARLDHLQLWSAETSLTLTPSEQAFLDASIAERERRQAKEEAQAEREANLQARARRVLQGLVAVFLIAAIVAGGLALFAFDQQTQAHDERDRAIRAEEQAKQERDTETSRRLAADSEDMTEIGNPELGVLLALEALEHFPFTPQVKAALTLAVDEYRSKRTIYAEELIGHAVYNARWSPDGTKIAGDGGEGFENVVAIWDAATGAEIISIPSAGSDEDCPDIARVAVWSPSGDRIAAKLHRGCGVAVWDTTTAERLLFLADFESLATTVEWSPDGKSIMVGHEDGTISQWDASTGASKTSLTGHFSQVTDIVRSPNDQWLATASADGVVILWDAATYTPHGELIGHVGPVNSIAWSPDSKQIVTGGNDSLPRIWDVDTLKTRLVLRGHDEPVNGVDWTQDGRQISTTSEQSGVTKIWHAATGTFLFDIPGTTQTYGNFSPDGSQLITANKSRYGEFDIWDVAPISVRLIGQHPSGLYYSDWSPDGTMIATQGPDGVRIWDAQTGQLLITPGPVYGSTSATHHAAWSPDSAYLAFPFKDVDSRFNNRFLLVVMNVDTGDTVDLQVPDQLWPMMVDWSPDGAYIAVSVFNAEGLRPVLVWDAKTHALLWRFEPDDDCVQTFADFSPNSSKLLAGCFWFGEEDRNRSLRIWDVKTGELISKFEGDHGSIFRAAWSPNGDRILVGYRGVAEIWDVETGNVLTTFAAHGTSRIDGVDWHPDGIFVATGDEDGLVKVWHSETGKEVTSFLEDGQVQNTQWSPAGTHIIIAGPGLTEPVIKRVWLSTEELVDYARECCVTRELTPEERAQFGLPERD